MPRVMFSRVAITPLLLVCAALSATDTNSTPTLEINPATVAVSDLRESQVQVVLINNGTSTLSNVWLSFFTNTGITVAIVPSKQRPVPAHGVAVWMAILKRTDAGALPGTVNFTATFRTKLDSVHSIMKVTTGSLAVTRAGLESLEQIAKADIKTALASLTDYRDGYVYLAVSDMSGTDLHLQNITVFCPKFISFQLGQEAKTCKEGAVDFKVNRKISPQQIETFAFVVRAAGAIQPGKHLLLFKTNLQWNSAGTVQSASLASSQEVAIGVLAESELLTALGVPTFLLLPGFLILTFIGIMRSWGWRLSSPSGDADFTFPPEAKSPEFWFYAVTLSIVAALLFGRYYLEGYSLDDVVRVWLESILATFLIYGGCVVINRWWIRRWAERVPKVGDRPELILRKMARRGESLSRPAYRWAHEGQEVPVYVVGEPNARAAAQWVAPAIVVNWKATEQRAGIFWRVRFVERASRKTSTPLELADALAKMVTEDTAIVEWKQIDDLNWPIAVASSDLTSAEQERLVPIENVFV